MGGNTIASSNKNEELCWWYRPRMEFCGLADRKSGWWNIDETSLPTKCAFPLKLLSHVVHANPLRPFNQMERRTKLNSINERHTITVCKVPMLSARKNQQNHLHSLLWLLMSSFPYLCSSLFLLLAFLHKKKSTPMFPPARTMPSEKIFCVFHFEVCTHKKCAFWDTQIVVAKGEA